MKAVIEKVTSVRKGVCLISFRGMRADLTDCITIKLDDIKNWYGVDSYGYSKAFEIKEGITIYFDSVSIARRLINPRFEE